MDVDALTIDPQLATGDGALGFWKALPQVFTTTRTQRCQVHKTANVLDKLHQIWMAPAACKPTKRSITSSKSAS